MDIIGYKKKKLNVTPTRETQKMIFKSQRKLNSKTARNMLTWSHYQDTIDEQG
jgi:putative transposase